MTKRFFLLLVLFFSLHGRVFCDEPLSSIDPDQQGPANFYYVQRDEEPWRLPESTKILLLRSAGVGTVAILLWGYLEIRKRKT